ncbi:MAG: XRE family transcriptional regulator [Moraxellaceae bacterium]|nr:XRE family transcriptional regulator [Moraxellaceae bacterium]
MFCKERLKLAQNLRGLSYAEMADVLGYSIPHIKNFLNPKEISHPNQDVQFVIAKKLDLPLSFFEPVELNAFDSEMVNYRSFARVKAKNKNITESYIVLAQQINKYFEERISNLPSFQPLDIDSIDPLSVDICDVAALKLRGEWGVGMLPIRNMLTLLEIKGIRVFRLPLNVQEVDALSVTIDGQPFVFLNTYKSAERMRFDAAHELAHIILHHFDKRATSEYEQDNRVKESEADRFASSFLMPTDAFLKNKPNYISLENMIEYKKYWGVSLAAVNYKLHKLGEITDWNYRSNCVKMNTLNYHKKSLKVETMITPCFLAKHSGFLPNSLSLVFLKC